MNVVDGVEAGGVDEVVSVRRQRIDEDQFVSSLQYWAAKVRPIGMSVFSGTA